MDTLLTVTFDHRSDTVSAAQTLATGDVVKIQLGAHIDGFAALQTETLIIGATAAEPATGRKADVVKAAWHAAQIAIRQMTVDEKNSTITESVTKVAGQWDCKPVEGGFGFLSAFTPLYL